MSNTELAAAMEPAFAEIEQPAEHEDEGQGEERDEALPPEMAAWGQRLGADLGKVRLKRGGAASAQADALGAQAFTDGQDIALGRGKSAGDKELVAHEVAHVAQVQHGASAAGPLTKKDGATGALETDADHAASALVHGSGPVRVLAGEGGVHLKPVLLDPPSPAKLVRAELMRLGYEAMTVAKELNSAGDRGGGAYKETAPRAMAELSRLASGLLVAGSALVLLTPEEKKALVSVGNFVYQFAAMIAMQRNLEVPLNLIKVILEAHLGPMNQVNKFHFADMTMITDPAEKAATIEENLGVAAGEVQAALVDSKEGADVAGEAGLGRLTTVGALGSVDADTAARLRPIVEGLAQDVRRLYREHAQGGRARELRIRMSKVCFNFDLPGLTEETMDQVLDKEVAAGKGYTPEQEARFIAATKKVASAMRNTFGRRAVGVRAIQGENQIKDPPKAPSLLHSLALAALSAATGGIGAVILGAWEHHKEVGGEVAPLGARLIAAIGEKIVEKAGDYVIEKVGEKLHEGEEPKELEGGKLSADPLTNFFGMQEIGLLDAEQDESDGDADKELASRANVLAADPEGAIAEMEGLVAAARKGKADAENIQADKTRIALFNFLTGGDLSGEAKGEGKFKGTDLTAATKLQQTGHGVENDLNVRGMLSMEFMGHPDTDVPVVLYKAWIKGLNKLQRDRFLDTKIVDLKTSMRARGMVSVARSKTANYVQVARNEVGEFFTEEGDDAEDWLIEKGGGDTMSPKDAKQRAAQRILEEEIGPKSLREHGVELED